MEKRQFSVALLVTLCHQINLKIQIKQLVVQKCVFFTNNALCCRFAPIFSKIFWEVAEPYPSSFGAHPPSHFFRASAAAGFECSSYKLFDKLMCVICNIILSVFVSGHDSTKRFPYFQDLTYDISILLSHIYSHIASWTQKQVLNRYKRFSWTSCSFLVIRFP